MSDPKKQILLVIVVVLVGYVYLTERAVEQTRDLEVVEKTAYLAAGQAGLRIIDLSIPDSPREVGYYDTLGSANAVAIRDNYAYVADGREGLRVIDVSNPAAPREVGGFDTPGNAEDVAIAGRFAYVADGRSGLLVIDIDNPEKPVQPEGQQPLNLRGGASRVASRGEYAFVAGSGETIRVVRISRQGALQEVGSVDVRGRVWNLEIFGNRAYVAAGRGGLHVLDVSDPEKITPLGVYELGIEAKGVDVVGPYAYLADGSAGLRILDLGNLKEIKEVGRLSGLTDARDVRVSGSSVYVADGYVGLRVVEAVVRLDLKLISPAEERGNTQDVAVQGQYAFLANEGRGVRMVDIAQPDSPNEVAFYDTPGDAIAVQVAGDFVYVAERGEGLRVLTFSLAEGVPEITERRLVETEGEVNDLALTDQFAYVADGSAGLLVLDIRDPSTPVRTGVEDTPGNANGVAVFGDYAYVADSGSGLRVINIIDPAVPTEVGSINIAGEARKVVVVQVSNPDRVLAFVAAGNGGLQVVDVSEPNAPQLAGVLPAQDRFIMDVSVDGDRAYLAARGQGLRVVDIADPVRPVEVGSLSLPGEARAVTVTGHYVLVAAHNRGMRVVDVANPAAPVEAGFYDAPRSVQDVVLAGDFAYLTDGERGLRIEDISNPSQPREVGHYDEMGKADGLAIRENLIFVAEQDGLRVLDISDPRALSEVSFVGVPGRGLDIALQGDYAYYAASEQGLRIFNVSDPKKIEAFPPFRTAGLAQGLAVSRNYVYVVNGPAGLNIVNVQDPRDPKPASLIDEFRDSRSVVVMGDHAFLADGENGLWVVRVARPFDPEIIAYLDTPGTALELVNLGDYLFVADGAGGVHVVYVNEPERPLLVGSLEPGGESVGIAVRQTAEGFSIFVAAGDRGMQVLRAEKRAEFSFTGTSEIPGFAPFRRAVRAPFASLRGGEDDLPRKDITTFRRLAGEIVLAFVGYLLWLAFFAQFALPVQQPGDRLSAFIRLFTYSFGFGGQAVRIENGNVRLRAGEQRRRGPGVVLLDTASAAMLRTKTVFRRPIGPGVVFTNRDEFVHDETVDLHNQIQPATPLGPVGKKDPFEPRRKDESEEEYQARQDGRRLTSGWTRDGVEVVPKIMTIFKIKSEPGSGGTEFGYDAESVRLAITREGVLLKELRDMHWYEVPPYLAVDLWREYLSRFTLNELFDPRTGELKKIPKEARPGAAGDHHGDRGETGLEIIKRMVKARLTQSDVLELNEFGEHTGKLVPSREYRDVIERMGIKVSAVSISSLAFPPAVETMLVQNWISTWLQRAQAEHNFVERQRSYAVHDGKEAALKEFADHAARPLAELLVGERGNPLPPTQRAVPSLEASLERLLSGTQRMIVHDTYLHQILENEEKEISDLIEWVRR